MSFRLPVVLSLGLLISISWGVLQFPATPATGLRNEHSESQRDRMLHARVDEAYGKLSLSFEANHGQTDPQVKFLSRGNGHALFLTSSEVVLSLTTTRGGGDTGTQRNRSEERRVGKECRL